MLRISASLVILGLLGATGTAVSQETASAITISDPRTPPAPEPKCDAACAPSLSETPPPPTAPECVPLPPSPDDPEMLRTHPRYLPQVWGVTGVRLFASGDKMAPNGVVYDPLFTYDFDLNIGLLPQKKLYVFSLGSFWTQKATSGVTNPKLGAVDFSKRQMDLTIGLAWNYWDYFEARVWAYSYNNLNRGMQLDKPFGYNDGVVVENRYYIPKSNLFDLPRLNFLSIGYYTSKELTGADGVYFEPGLFLRAYLTYEFMPRQYYVYADTQMISQRAVSPRFLLFDDGFAARPFRKLEGLEFRAGVYNTVDVRVDNVRTLLYLNVQVIF
jgi:hypothetical protein